MAELVTFEEWYGRKHPVVVNSMLAMFGDLDVATEATDEAFSRALEHWGRVSVMVSPTGWTLRVAVNLARRRHRRRALEQRLLLRQAPHGSTSGPAGEAWLLVRDLPMRQRTAVVLRHVVQMTEPEIADVMGVARSTVSATLRAAHASLASDLALSTENGHG